MAYCNMLPCPAERVKRSRLNQAEFLGLYSMNSWNIRKASCKGTSVRQH